MSKVDQAWELAIRDRFKGRENLNPEQLFSQYFEGAGLPNDAVFECLQLLEFEYHIPVGVLRPEDKLEKLFSPVAAKTPWQWLVFRTREGDSETEINYELGKRMRRAGTTRSWSRFEKIGDLTVLDLLRAWAGLTPNISHDDVTHQGNS